MVQHTIFAAAPAAVQNSDTQGINLATAFYVTSGTTWTSIGLRFWLDATSNAPTSGYHAYLSSGNSAGTLTGLASGTLDSAVKGAWNTVNWSSPVALTVGTKYWVTVYFPGGCYSATAYAFNSAVQAADGSALYGAASSEVLPGNGTYSYAGPGDMSQAATFHANWYGVDVIADDGRSAPTTVPHHAAVAAKIGPVRWAARLWNPRWAAGTRIRWKAAIVGSVILPAATQEWLPLTVSKVGVGSAVPISTGCAYSIVPGTVTTPGAFTACTVVDGYPSAWVASLAAGTYTMFVQITQGTEVVVRNLGQLVLT